MKNPSKAPALIFFTVVAIIITLVIVGIIKGRREPHAASFPDTIAVGTTSHVPHVNLIAKTLAHKVLQYDTLSVMITEMPVQYEGKYSAFVVKTVVPHSYVIFLSKSVRGQSHLRQVLSHEFAHIHQYETGQLVPIDIDNGIYVWEGDTIDFTSIEYNDRIFEKDAYLKEHVLRGSLFLQLFPKE